MYISASRLEAICAKERHYSPDINKLRPSPAFRAVPAAGNDISLSLSLFPVLFSARHRCNPETAVNTDRQTAFNRPNGRRGDVRKKKRFQYSRYRRAARTRLALLLILSYRLSSESRFRASQVEKRRPEPSFSPVREKVTPRNKTAAIKVTTRAGVRYITRINSSRCGFNALLILVAREKSSRQNSRRRIAVFFKRPFNLSAGN